MQENNVFSTLNAINCNEHTERKGNLTYLSLVEEIASEVRPAI